MTLRARLAATARAVAASTGSGPCSLAKVRTVVGNGGDVVIEIGEEEHCGAGMKLLRVRRDVPFRHVRVIVALATVLTAAVLVSAWHAGLGMDA